MGVLYWNEERIAALRELFDQGLTYKAIGDALGKTSAVISAACSNNGLRRCIRDRPLPDDFMQIAPTLFIRQACKHWKADSPTITRWHKLAGTSPRTQRSARKPKPSRPQGGTPWVRATVLIVDDSAAGRAQRALQKWGPVFRIATIQPSDKTGDYSVHGKRMTVHAMIEMADRKEAA